MPVPTPPARLAPGLRYIASGLAQLLLDWAAYVALTAAGVGTGLANPLARAAAMLLGFWLHGSYTFAEDGTARLGWARLARYLPGWTVLTLVGTAAMWVIVRGFGLEVAWLAKPMVEAVLAVASFLLLRHWVYR